MKNTKILVIINESHQLMGEQIEILNEKFNDNWERLNIPNTGLDLKGFKELVDKIEKDGNDLVIASPIPVLFALLKNTFIKWSVFHNDKRDKKELPNGKIIMVVAQTGWVII